MESLIYFILILGVVVFSHELGHFIFAKRAGIYVYEFALGMGPKLVGFKRKGDETSYSIRLVPIGGFVKMAGEEIEEDKTIPVGRRFQSTSWMNRVLTVIAGACFNFVLAILLFFVVALINGSPELTPYISSVSKNYPAYESGIKKGDLIVAINGHKVTTWDEVLIEFESDKDKVVTFKIRRNDEYKEIEVKAVKESIDGKEVFRFGIGTEPEIHYGFVSAVRYAFINFGHNISVMFRVIGKLITGALGLNSLAGPIGIYNVVDQTSKTGFTNVLNLIAFISLNVGFVNLIPFPAFDGGRVLFLVIEKIIGKPVNAKVENIIHMVGMAILLLFMLLITIKDIRANF